MTLLQNNKWHAPVIVSPLALRSIHTANALKTKGGDAIAYFTIYQASTFVGRRICSLNDLMPWPFYDSATHKGLAVRLAAFLLIPLVIISYLYYCNHY